MFRKKKNNRLRSYTNNDDTRHEIALVTSANEQTKTLINASQLGLKLRLNTHAKLKVLRGRERKRERERSPRQV